VERDPPARRDDRPRQRVASSSVLRSISEGGPGDAQILTAPPGYQLSVAPQRIDVHRARTLFDARTPPPPRVARTCCGRRFPLWQGPSLSGVPDRCGHELEELRLAVTARGSTPTMADGRHSAVIVELSPLVRANSLAERTVGQLIARVVLRGPA